MATAAFGFSATTAVPAVAGLGLVIVIFFGILDSYYLREERLFRYLYDDARQGNVGVYSMNKNDYSSKFRSAMTRSWPGRRSAPTCKRSGSPPTCTRAIH